MPQSASAELIVPVLTRGVRDCGLCRSAGDCKSDAAFYVLPGLPAPAQAGDPGSRLFCSRVPETAAGPRIKSGETIAWTTALASLRPKADIQQTTPLRTFGGWRITPAMNCSSRRLLAFAALALSTGCTPEGFEVTPCLLHGQLAFRIHEIEGLLSDYQPRPMSVLVLEDFAGSHEEFMGSEAPFRWPGLWSAELKYGGYDRGVYERRPSRKLIVYGQRLPHWEVAQPAKPLTDGKSYSVIMMDGGRYSQTSFTAGEPFPACP